MLFPLPRCICFYNGRSKKEDRIVLNLNDAFTDSDVTEPDINVTVTMININYGHNKELMEACKPLNEYAWFVDRMRSYTKGTGKPEKSADMAIDEMPDDWTIKPLLIENRAEVKRMWLTEYNAEEHMETMKEDALYFARQQVLEEMKDVLKEAALAKDEAAQAKDDVAKAEEENIRSVKALMSKQNLSADTAMDILDTPMEKRELYKKIICNMD